MVQQPNGDRVSIMEWPPTQHRYTTAVPLSPGIEWRRNRPVWLVAALCVATFGLYPVIWLGLSWAEMKREVGDERMSPWGHVLSQFVPIYGWFRVHAHYRVLEEMLRAVGANGSVYPGLAVLGWIVCAFLDGLPGDATLFLEIPLSICIVGHGQAALNAYRRALSGHVVPTRVHWAEWVTLVCGAGLWLLTALAPLIPDDVPVEPIPETHSLVLPRSGEAPASDLQVGARWGWG